MCNRALGARAEPTSATAASCVILSRASNALSRALLSCQTCRAWCVGSVALSRTPCCPGALSPLTFQWSACCCDAGDRRCSSSKPKAMNQDVSADDMRLYRVHKTVLKMLSKRGYNVLEESLNATPQAFMEELRRIQDRSGGCVTREAATVNVGKIDDPNDVVFVFFSDEEKGLGTRPIQKYVERLLQAGSKSGIIVYRNNITAIAKKLLLPGAIPNVRVEVFRESELLVDITEHQLVPEHVVLTNEQKLEVLARYKLKETQLPKIQAVDPVARYFGLVRGQVVKITRLSETAGRYVTYRVCQ